MDRGCVAVQIKIEKHAVRWVEAEGEGGADDRGREGSSAELRNAECGVKNNNLLLFCFFSLGRGRAFAAQDQQIQQKLAALEKIRAEVLLHRDRRQPVGRR